MSRVNASERFVVEHTLGRGGMGTVHQAYDNARGTVVALKMLQRVDPTSLLRFKTEFRALANLSHRNLVQLFELVQRDDDYLLSMELVDGGDFLAYVRSEGGDLLEVENAGDTESIPGTPAGGVRAAPMNDNQAPRHVARLDERKLRHALRQLAEGLHALHGFGHLHRDLKPANVLVFKSDERLVICDFGLVVENTVHRARTSLPAQHLDGPSQHSLSSTSGEVAGTMAFMSPEQMAGSEIAPASDWYSVGAMLYQALTLRVPFDPHLAWADAVRVRQQQLPDHPLTLAPDAPADLAALAMALLNTDPKRRAGYADVIATLDGKETLVSEPSPLVELLVGRERELQRLHKALSATRLGRASVALVSGMSGMGKSAVVQRFLSECEQQDTLVLRGRCYEAEELPYKAFDPLMDALSGYLLSLDNAQVRALLPPDIPCLVELFPVLGRVPAIAEQGLVSSVADPFERRRRATTSCRRLLRRIASSRPLVLYVDDLQWGDLDSGPLFAELLRGKDAPPLLLLFAFRAEDEASGALIRALRDDYLPNSGVREVTQLRIEALGREDAERLTQALLAGTPEAERAVDVIVQEACGSPFFIRELASFVRVQGMQDPRQLKLQTVLKARVAALPEHSRTLLEFVAAAGRPEQQTLLNEASGLGKRAFSAGQILKAHNLVHASGTLESARIEAYHDRIRETVYAELLPERRRYLHRVLAVTLEQFAEQQGTPRDAEALCDHWHKAGERKRALDYAVTAAEQAEATLAFLHAAKLYGKAIELVEGDLKRTSEFEGRIGKALAFAGRGVDAADAYFRAMRSADEQGAQEYRRLAITQLLRSGSLDRAFTELANAEDVLGLRFPSSNLKAIGMLVWRRLRTKLNDKALAAHAGDKAPAQVSQQLDNLYQVSVALSAVDFLRGGVYTAEHTLRALEHGHPRHLASALSVESLRSAGPNTNPAQTQWIIENGMELARRSGDPFALAVTTGTVGVSRYLEGRFLEAIRMVRESHNIHREQLHSKMAWDISTLRFFEMRALSQVGQVNEIIAYVPDVLRDAEARGDQYASTLFRVSRSCWAWLGADQAELAQQQVEIAQKQWVQQPYQLVHYYMLQAAGECALYQRRAAEVWERALREHKQMGMVNKIQFTRVEALYLIGRLGLQLSHQTNNLAAHKHAEKCAKQLARSKARWAQPLGQLLLGCSAAKQAPDHARALLAPLPEVLEKLDMLLSAAVVRYRLGQLSKSAEGPSQIEAARATIAALGIANPEAYVEMLAPAAL